MKIDHRIQILIAVIGALGAIIAGFFGGSVYTTMTVQNTVANYTSFENNNSTENTTNITTDVNIEGDSAADIARTLLGKIEELYQKITLLEEDKSQLSISNVQLEAEKEKLEDELSNGSSSYSDLENQYNELLEEKTSLESENEKLRKIIENGSGGTSIYIPKGGIALADLEIFNDNYDFWDVNTGERADSLGHDYSDSMSYFIAGSSRYNSTAYAEYKIDGQYKSLKGNIAPHKDFRNDGKALVRVYGQVYKDGKYSDYSLLYASKSIDVKTDVFAFEIPESKMKNVRFLKIEVEFSGVNVLLTDWTLS